jgi:hypothetical protein
MNKINKIYSETSWRPDFYFNTGNPDGETKKFVKQNAKSGSLCFVPSEFSKQYQSIDNCCFLNTQPLKRDSCFDDISINQVKNISVSRLSQYWSDRIEKVVYLYHSMYAVLQIVAYLGFNEVYLLGCDLGYGRNSPHMLFDTGQDPIDYVNKGDSKKYDYPMISYLVEAVKSRTLGKSIANGILFKIMSSKAGKLVSAMLSKVGIGSDENHFTDEYGYKPIDLTDINKEIIKGHICIMNDRSVYLILQSEGILRYILEWDLTKSLNRGQ